MKATPLLLALACSAALATAPAWAQTAPAKPAAKPAAGKPAAPSAADGKTLSLGGGSGSGSASATVAGLDAGAMLSPLWPAGASALAADNGGQAQVVLPRQSFAVYAVTATP